MAQVGTIKREFNRAYIYLNPNPYEGPPVWRLTNLPIGSDKPIDDGLAEIFTVLPIDKEEMGNTVRLFFNIVGLPDTRKASKTPNYYNRLFNNFFQDPNILPKQSKYNLKSLRGIPPVSTAINGNIGVVYFDISDLPSLEDVRRKQRFYLTSRTFKYNSKSVDDLTATVPLESQVADGTATVSFDISTLPEA